MGETCLPFIKGKGEDRWGVWGGGSGKKEVEYDYVFRILGFVLLSSTEGPALGPVRRRIFQGRFIRSL